MTCKTNGISSSNVNKRSGLSVPLPSRPKSRNHNVSTLVALEVYGFEFVKLLQEMRHTPLNVEMAVHKSNEDNCKVLFH